MYICHLLRCKLLNFVYIVLYMLRCLKNLTWSTDRNTGHCGSGLDNFTTNHGCSCTQHCSFHYERYQRLSDSLSTLLVYIDYMHIDLENEKKLHIIHTINILLLRRSSLICVISIFITLHTEHTCLRCASRPECRHSD